MKKIAIFGKPGSGKSTLSKHLAAATGIGLYPLDLITYQQNGELVEPVAYDSEHQRLLSKDSWIIDGLGPMKSFNQRLNAADTFIYIELPYTISYWLVTKRWLMSLFVKPEGWPTGSSVLKGTLASYKVLKSCPKFWNEHFLQDLEAKSANKSLYVIRSLSELNNFIENHVADRPDVGL